MTRDVRGGDRRRALAYVIAIVASLTSVGCLPQERINRNCRWTADTAVLASPWNSARRAHLVEDVRVAKDLGIRYADASAGRMSTPAWRQAVTSCTEQSLATISRVHDVSRAELDTIGSDRELWIDLLAVFLPMALLFTAASRALARRVALDKDRGVAAILLAALSPLAAGVALAVTQIWGTVVEQLRLRNEHISYRTFELPASRHGWLLWGIGVTIFIAIASSELLRRREDSVRKRDAFYSRFG